jgi:hypothetical protein
VITNDFDCFVPSDSRELQRKKDHFEEEIIMRYSWIAGAGCLLVAIAPVAGAQTYKVNYGFNYNSPTLDINYLGSSEDCYAGPFSAVFQGTPPPFSSSNPFSVYCVDITHNITPPATETVTASQVGAGFSSSTVNPYVSVAQLQEAAYLADTYSTAVGADTTQAQLDSGAALQVAIWDVVGGDNILSSGNDISHSGQNFWISNTSPSIISQANAMLNNLGAAVAHGGGGGNGLLLTIFPSLDRDVNSGQNMLGGAPGTPGGGFTPSFSTTPEGSTLAMLALGLAPLLGGRWLARRRSAR